MIANTPSPPYYAVIFTTERSYEGSDYHEMADRMIELASEQPGFLGVETTEGITISYWKDKESIAKWKAHPEHTLARNLGREKWYDAYKTRIVYVESDYQFKRES